LRIFNFDKKIEENENKIDSTAYYKAAGASKG
jgi:hypothetical protein